MRNNKMYVSTRRAEFPYRYIFPCLRSCCGRSIARRIRSATIILCVSSREDVTCPRPVHNKLLYIFIRGGGGWVGGLGGSDAGRGISATGKELFVMFFRSRNALHHPMKHNFWLLRDPILKNNVIRNVFFFSKHNFNIRVV